MKANYRYFDYSKFMEILEEKRPFISRIYGIYRIDGGYYENKDNFLLYKDGKMAWEANRDKDFNSLGMTQFDIVEVSPDNYEPIIKVFNMEGSWWNTPSYEIVYKDGTSEIVDGYFEQEKEFDSDNLRVLKRLISDGEFEGEALEAVQNFIKNNNIE